jgi:hypothetical protein
MIGFAYCILFLFVPEFYTKARKQDVFVLLKPLQEFNLTYLQNGNSFDERYLKLSVVLDSNRTLKKRYYMPDEEHKNIEVFLQKLGVLKGDNIQKIIPFSFSNNQLEKYGSVEVTYQNNSTEKFKVNNVFLKGKEISFLERGIYYLLTVTFSFIGLFGVRLIFGLAKLHVEHYKKTGQTLEITNVVAAKMEGFKYVLRGFKSKNKETEI